MPYVKKLIMKGFKSFPRKTEVPFNPEINVILGPNGSGKSNITDALCFVLGRMNIKSMRAAKASNLIFLGNKHVGAAKEASVELVFDNIDRTFSIDQDEISIKRIVRKNGQGIYKINDETKNRQEVLSLLAQAGIDPNGFNIVLQGEIQNFVRMHPEERRKVIEEISGISVYESRKAKSLKELEKTEAKLKEVQTVLRERTSYMNNLEKERQQALKFKKLEENVKKYKASIINHDILNKKKELERVLEDIKKRNKEKEKVRKNITNIESQIKNLELKISNMNADIQKATGLEQEKLNREIANLRADLVGMNVKLENNENKLLELSKQKKEIQNSIQRITSDIEKLEEETPTTTKKQKEIEIRKEELDKLEVQRKKFYMMKSDLKSAKDKIEDKKNLLSNYLQESDFLLKQTQSLSKDLFDRKTDENKLNDLNISISEKKELLKNLENEESNLEKVSYSGENEIESQEKIIDKISKMDICPLCKNEITENHICSIKKEVSEKVEYLKDKIETSDRRLGEIFEKKKTIIQEIEKISSEIDKRERDMTILSNIEEKKEQIKSIQEKIDFLKEEIKELEKKSDSIENKINENPDVEKEYEELRLSLQDITIVNEENLNSEIAYKKRELERLKSSSKPISENEEEIKEEILELKKKISEKEKILEKKKQQETELVKKFEGLISQRDELQKEVRDSQIRLSQEKNAVHNIEQGINELKIGEARFRAEIENLETEMLDFENVEVVRSNREKLVQDLMRTQDGLSKIGSSVNLRSLEIYDSVKKEYDVVKEKVEVIEREKEEILKIINDIDTKKKRTFTKTLSSLNEIFTRNFSNLSSKGKVFLELENKKDPFEGGVDIVVKTGHGKYFDVTSLSGGEQTLVALSLIFAIQELKPYFFYLLDEIDAMLDKRNSERLSLLLKKYMKRGQYIVITHNEEVILGATTLYGVNMHEGVSKITSLKTE